ncbi:hypothetical protein M0R04_02775 [Candidatus Dojkabacteria bacterium]|jgi:hypothetical protein|nr:hypothetical protein [Candidatus Dojkabacteria bacterium]
MTSETGGNPAMVSFNKTEQGVGFEVKASQTPDLNRVKMETTNAVPQTPEPVATESNLPAVNEVRVGETAVEARRIVDAMRVASDATFNAQKEAADVKSVQGADKGVLDVGLKIISNLETRLKQKAENLSTRANTKAQTVAGLEGKVVDMRYNKDFGQQAANVESTAMQTMLQEVSGKNDYYRRGEAGKNEGFLGVRKFFRGLKESVTLGVAELRYNNARDRMVKLSTRAQYFKTAAAGLGAFHDLMAGTVQRTELNATNNLEGAKAQATATQNTAESQYKAFVK